MAAKKTPEEKAATAAAKEEARLKVVNEKIEALTAKAKELIEEASDLAAVNDIYYSMAVLDEDELPNWDSSSC